MRWGSSRSHRLDLDLELTAAIILFVRIGFKAISGVVKSVMGNMFCADLDGSVVVTPTSHGSHHLHFRDDVLPATRFRSV